MTNDVLSFLLQGGGVLLGSFVGTLGFAMILNAPRKAWLPTSAIGMLAEGVYWGLLQCSVYEPLAMFLGALLGSVLAQYCARRMRMIATVFIVLAIIPLVPGLGLYRCMSFLAQQMYSAGAAAGVGAMADIVMIALGVAMGSFLFRQYMHFTLRKEASR